MNNRCYNIRLGGSGTALGVIIPKERELIMPISRPRRIRAVEEAAGRYRGAASFTGERQDRF